MPVTLEPASADDFRAVSHGLPPVRVRGFAGKKDGILLGVGGIAFTAGAPTAFVELTEEARKHPVALHKAALKTLAMAREMGLRRLVATSTTGHPAAERWLLRLGFKPQCIDGIEVFVREDYGG